ncbi:hypothetical protein [Sideroxydans sp. CL21]|uniref:hypothetical protein n=1 Tax=Sideroxydans sp. CL21 TaxID=2600596 RepID=UPI0012A8E5F6|nr:hypothetical protein [Sideroxydans sp. CL21]VVC85752.1 hypothetical protein [Sideroxydans sp. CL21]
MSEQHKAAAMKRGTERTAQMEQDVADAMRAIVEEMQANNGIYPHNGGAVSMAELARRAGINESTLYKKDNASLKERAKLWLDTLKKKETVGRMRVRKTHAERADSWEKKYKALELRHICTELELQSLQAEAQKLRDDNAALLEQMRVSGRSKVTPIPKRKN